MRKMTGCLMVLVALAACSAGDDPDAPNETPNGAAAAADLLVDTLISTGSGVLGDPTDLEIGSDGTVFVLDGLNAQVHRIGADGEYLGAFAGEGAGPAELMRPGAVARGRADTLWVVDAGNGRLQAYAGNGEHLATVPTHGWAVFPSHVTEDGQLVASAAGQDTVLAAVFDRAGERVRSLGTAPAPFGSGVAIDMADLAAMIADGEVPPVFRNTAFPYATPSRDVWLARPVDGLLERYDASATNGDEGASGGASVAPVAPTVTIHLDEPELPAIREHWIAENRDPASDGVSVLLYVADIYAGDDDVWVLLNQPPTEPAVLLRYGRDGDRRGRWVLPQATGASKLAVDRARERLLLGIGDFARVISLSLPT